MKITKSIDVVTKPVGMAGAKDVDIRVLISTDDGAENFAMRMFEVQPGGYTPLHTHPNEHEVFIVEGHGVLVYAGQEHPFEAGHVIFVEPDSKHQFKNTGGSILKFLCLVPLK
ncbi:MAG: cupin domain-containing protein [Planctomycetota bacterium]|jgi:quercetin dioxygenase-like cupin family protein